LRRKKCDENHPSCRACLHLGVKCQYSKPSWWSNIEQRKVQKERLKNKIKNTKLNEKNNSIPGTNCSATYTLLNFQGWQVLIFFCSFSGQRNRPLPPPLSSPYSPVDNFNRPFFPGTPIDPFGSQLPTPALGSTQFGQMGQMGPYEVDVRTERQLYVNDIPTRIDTSFSTFNTFVPPQMHATLPNMPNDEWLPPVGQTQAQFPYQPMGPMPFVPEGQSFSQMQLSIPVLDTDRPLLNHFVEKVLRLIFPILEVHQKGHERAQAILQSLETNKSYLHCCLSVAAIHVKSTVGVINEEVDHDIMRHRYEAVAQLCQSLNEDSKHEQILEATLAMILFHCSVGGPDDHLPDIAWNDHFHAATSLINKLELPNALVQSNNNTVQPPFNMTLASWIDILGATMIGKSPQFAHTYRTKHLSGTSSGLRELMGCDDRVMYLISEIACLDALKAEGLVDDLSLCSHVSALGQQLDATDYIDKSLEHPYSALSGGIRPDQLTKNMTAIFRLAARIYLCSLVPGFDRNQASNVNLVDAVRYALQFIPSGPDGYDRSLVWPLLITGAFSTPFSSFRHTLQSRIIEMGDQAEFGSFGRMYRVLVEVWRLSDDPITPIPGLDGTLPSPTFPTSGNDVPISPTGSVSGMRELKKRDVHWRDVMTRNGWKYLLI
jgi:hypothetical protein